MKRRKKKSETPVGDVLDIVQAARHNLPIVDEGEETNADTELGVTDTQVVITVANHSDPERRIQVHMAPDEARAYSATLRAEPTQPTPYGPRVLVRLNCTCGCPRYFSAAYMPAGVLVFADQIDEAVRILEARA